MVIIEITPLNGHWRWFSMVCLIKAETHIESKVMENCMISSKIRSSEENFKYFLERHLIPSKKNVEKSRRRHKNQRSEHVLGIILQYDFIQNHHLFDLVEMLSIKLLSMISSFRLGFEKWKVSSSTRTRFHVPRAIVWLPQKLHFLRWLCS